MKSLLFDPLGAVTDQPVCIHFDTQPPPDALASTELLRSLTASGVRAYLTDDPVAARPLVAQLGFPTAPIMLPDDAPCDAPLVLRVQ